MLLEERKLFKIKKKFKNKEIHNACAKMQNNIVAGCIKGWSANLKLKKLSLLKLPLPLGLYILKEMQKWGFMRDTFVCQWFKLLLHSEFSVKSLTLKVCKPMKGMKIIWQCYKIFWSEASSRPEVFLGRYSKNMQQIYRRTRMSKCNFNKLANWHRTSAWMFSCNFAAYFQNTFS